jgi:LPS export ABC transporter protein LptC
MRRTLIAMAIGGLSWLGCSTPGDGVVPLVKGTPRALAVASPGVPGSPTPAAEQEPVRLEKTVIKTKQGQRWELQADEVDWMNDNSQAKAQEVTWFLLNPQGQRTVRVESSGADVDMNSELVTFTGEVVARRLDSEESLVVQRLIYNGKSRIFSGSEGVLWKRQGIELAGQTLTATAELDKVQLKGRVKGKTEGGLLKMEDLVSPSEQRDR